MVGTVIPGVELSQGLDCPGLGHEVAGSQGSVWTALGGLTTGFLKYLCFVLGRQRRHIPRWSDRTSRKGRGSCREGQREPETQNRVGGARPGAAGHMKAHPPPHSRKEGGRPEWRRTDAVRRAEWLPAGGLFAGDMQVM